MNTLTYYFGIPDGAIYGNIVAEPIIAGLTLLIMFLFRNMLMKRFVEFHHRHKTEHQARLERDKKND